eukprot:6199276-Pleurochrysis_carterae.AAC.2
MRDSAREAYRGHVVLAPHTTTGNAGCRYKCCGRFRGLGASGRKGAHKVVVLSNASANRGARGFCAGVCRL